MIHNITTNKSLNSIGINLRGIVGQSMDEAGSMSRHFSSVKSFEIWGKAGTVRNFEGTVALVLGAGYF